MADLTQADIEDWIANRATGVFHYTKVMDGLIDKTLYPTIRTIMHRCKDKGIAYPVNGRDGWWRPADLNSEEVYWWDLDSDIGENIILPLDMNQYCYIPKPSIVLVAGLYNAGKTALLLNVVNDNIVLWKDNLYYYVSEGAEMVGNKIKALNSMMPTPPPFKMYRRTENFADIVRLHPDGLHVIDYLRVDMDKPYATGSKLFEIFNALGPGGIAVVAMQKPQGRKLAFGGASTAFEPSLYISMEKSYLEFEKVKIPKQDKDWSTIKIEFKIARGVNFYEVHESYG